MDVLELIRCYVNITAQGEKDVPHKSGLREHLEIKGVDFTLTPAVLLAKSAVRLLPKTEELDRGFCRLYSALHKAEFIRAEENGPGMSVAFKHSD